MLCETPNVRLGAQYRIATLAVDWAGDVRDTLDDIDTALRIVQARPAFDVLVLRGFEAGFGDSFDALADDDTAELGQRVARRLAAVDAITIANIDGPCLGGALELALACDYLAAAGTATTRLGMPQVRSGSIPCWGGTVRLARRIGLEGSLDLMLSGRRLSAAQALKIGLVDRAFGPRIAPVHFEHFVIETQNLARKPRIRPPVSDRLPWRRERLLRQARSRLRQSTSDDHAAAWEILRITAAGARHGRAEGFAAERRAVGRLAAIPRLATQQLERPAIPFANIAVVGAGTIGASLAQWASQRGHAVIVHDRNPQAARERMAEEFSEAVARRHMSAEDADRMLASITCTDQWDGIAAADLVIEATPESQSRKRAVLRRIDQVMRPSALLATTSTVLTIKSLATSLYHPERLLGLHIGHPAASTPFVEITTGPQTGPHVLGRVKAWLRDNGKTGVQTADRAGRVLGRVMLPYFHEALLLATEGFSIETIDAAMRQFGMAWGPFESMDAIGLDAVRASLRGMASACGRDLTPPALLKRLMARGHRGCKSGTGFYRHVDNGRPVNVSALPRARTRMTPVDGVHRLVARLLNAAFAVLGRQMADASTIDAIILSSGWPGFRGGPLHYASTQGLSKLVRELGHWAGRCGSRFDPCAELLRQAQELRRAAA